MKKTLILLITLVLVLPTWGQDYIESMSYNADKRGTTRTLQYLPDGEDFVCVNGHNRFTRALYGSHSIFRLETSDRPVFAAYNKSKSKHIRFRLSIGNKSIALDSTAYCESRYTAGRRTYCLTDPSWGKGKLIISTLAFPETDGAVWKIESAEMPKESKLLCFISEIRAKRLNRNGDMGADPADSFEAPLEPKQQEECSIVLEQTNYLVCNNYSLSSPSCKEGKTTYDKAEQARATLASQIKICTPDPFFNTIGGALSVAADGIWNGEVWLHGAVGWRMPLSGWRAAYTGDVLGWHDRARTHFDAYAASQVTDVAPVFSHPTQDKEMNLARAQKAWGTQMYSNGYICRNPHQNDKMHHYDMNLCYIDELLWHLNWTGDLEYARKMWTLLQRHLSWEKRNFDPDNDGLYDAYCCIWASDALQYNSGAVTHSSAYNYRANKLAAMIAKKLGKDSQPYADEASKILEAVNSRLWIANKGHWAEYQDFMGHKKLHESAGVWSIYHAIDSDIHDAFQAYQATRYIDTEIPHFPVKAEGLKDEGYATISTTNWLPYSWSINNVAFAEVMHTSLSYWQAGRNEEAFKLLKSSVLDGMYLGDSPGNFGQVSFYDAARGECYRDFGDPIGMASRAFVQGLFGILPDAMNNQLNIRPGFPKDWEYASLSTPDLKIDFKKKGRKDIYDIEMKFPKELALHLSVRAYSDRIVSLKVNGKKATWKSEKAASGYPVIGIETTPAVTYQIEIEWGGKDLQHSTYPTVAKAGDKWTLQANNIKEVYDPQGMLTAIKKSSTLVSGCLANNLGYRTLFVLLSQGQMNWWQPVSIEIKPLSDVSATSPFKLPKEAKYEPIDMDKVLNASVTQIFTNEYLTPRSPYTTLQVPKQGIGEWCHPKITAEINDIGVREQVKDNIFRTNIGIPFRSHKEGNNIAFTTLWDNYPAKINIPLNGKAQRVFLLMAGTTNHMQCHFVNGIIKINYTNGTSEHLDLVNPDNWCPIEQDFFVDGAAFKLPSPRPYRLHLKTGLLSRNLGKDLNIQGVYGRRIEGGAGILLDLPLNNIKELKSLEVETLANEVIIGLMGITLQR